MRSRAFLSAALVAALAVAFAPRAFAGILINVDKENQSMTVTVDGEQRYAWPVSTGAPGRDTPSGTFRPNRMDATHLSQEWDNAPMPHAIFFDLHGHAIHGFLDTRHIGDPGSHGCVRLAPEKAALLYSLIAMTGMRETTVVISGQTPLFQNLLMARRRALAEAKAALPDQLSAHSDAKPHPYEKRPATHLQEVATNEQPSVLYEALREPPLVDQLQAGADRQPPALIVRLPQSTTIVRLPQSAVRGQPPAANARPPQHTASAPTPATNARPPQHTASAPTPATNAREPQLAEPAPPPATNAREPQIAEPAPPPATNAREPQLAEPAPAPTTNAREPQTAAHGPAPATNSRQPQRAEAVPAPATNGQRPPAAYGQQPTPSAAYAQRVYRQVRPYYARLPYGMPPAYYAQYLRQYYYAQPAYQQQYLMLQPRNPF
jgi:L,D-transpeptidase catalytic domain